MFSTRKSYLVFPVWQYSSVFLLSFGLSRKHLKTLASNFWQFFQGSRFKTSKLSRSELPSKIFYTCVSNTLKLNLKFYLILMNLNSHISSGYHISQCSYIHNMFSWLFSQLPTPHLKVKDFNVTDRDMNRLTKQWRSQKDFIKRHQNSLV